MLGGAQSLHTNARDEALALPTEASARASPSGPSRSSPTRAASPRRPIRSPGSYFVETLTTQLEAGGAGLPRRDRRDGRDARARSRAASSSARSRSRRTGSSRRSSAATWSSSASTASATTGPATTPPLQRIDPDGERRQIERVRRVRAERDPAAWAAALRPARGRRPRHGQPPAADHRGGQGLRHGRRDQRPAAGGLRRPSRADHGLRSADAADRRPSRAAIRGLGKVHHVALIVRSIEDASGSGATCSACQLETVMDIPSDRVRIAFLAVGESKVELVEPTDDTTGVARFLAKQGRGLPPRLLRGREPRRDAAPARDRGPRADRQRAPPRRRGPGRVHPPAVVPRRARRADRGARAARPGRASASPG